MPKILLTPNFINKELHCPEAKRRIEYCDTAFPGLYIEARATSPGHGTFYLRYKNEAGKTCHIKIGRTNEITVAQARKKAKMLKAQIVLGADPRAEAKAAKQVIGFRKFSDEYLAHIKTRKRSYRNDESMLRLRIVPCLGDTPLNRIGRQQIQSFHTSLRDLDLSPASCDHHVKLVRAMLNLAVAWGHIDKNPADKIPLFREDNTMERYMSEAEQARLIEVLNTHKNRLPCLLILFLLSTGARKSEGMFAKWEDFDIDNKSWRIPATNSKSKKARYVPLNDTALTILAEVNTNREGRPYVFTNPNTGTCFSNINKTWQGIREAAGLPKLRLHDLRHQYASLLVNGGRSLYEVQQILGHSDPTVTQRYAHLSTGALQDAANAASVSLGGCPPDGAASG